MVGVGTPFEHERVDEPAVEADPNPHARLGVVGLFGPLLPDGTDVLSPFTHLPRLPAAPTDPAAVVAVTGVAAVLWVAGLVGWRWRDVQG